MNPHPPLTARELLECISPTHALHTVVSKAKVSRIAGSVRFTCSCGAGWLCESLAGSLGLSVEQMTRALDLVPDEATVSA